MGASIRIIKVVKDNNPMTGSEEELYTVEFECVVEESKDLIKELANNPLGQKAIALIERADFLPEGKSFEDAMKEEGKTEIIDEIIDLLKKKNKVKAAELIEKFAEEREVKKEKEEKEDE